MMKNIHTKIIIGIMGLIFLPVFCFSGGMDDKKELPPVKKQKGKVSTQPKAEAPAKTEGKKISFLFSEVVGCDNNVYLTTADRQMAAYFQTFFKATYKTPLNEKVNAVLSYDLFSLLYPDAVDASLVKNGFYAGLDNKLLEKVTFTSGMGCDIYSYPYGGDGEFIDYKTNMKLKQDLPDKLYHSLGYEFLFRHYDETKIRTATIGNVSTKHRVDNRYILTYEIGKYFKKDLFKMMYEYYYNDSNETFMKYYDYGSYTFGPSLTHLFSKKLFGFCSFTRQWRDFGTRTISTDASVHEWDRTYLITSAVYYNLTKDCTLNVTYNYRQNWSNEPTSRYAGSLISSGLFYKF